MKTLLEFACHLGPYPAVAIILVIGVIHVLKRGKLDIHFRYPRAKK